MTGDTAIFAPTTTGWILGSRGLLGSALCRELRLQGTPAFMPANHFSWKDTTLLPSQIAAAMEDFATTAAAAERWEIYWAAGVGAMNSTPDDLSHETRALTIVLRCLETNAVLMSKPGKIAFASTAGAIYAGCKDEVIDETSQPAPTTPYAREKLKQEELLQAFAAANDLPLLIARISTLYGTGQSATKRQGLLTNIARNIVRNQPIQIFVPFDTIRDYISADDAASEIVNIARNMGSPPNTHLKIVASEQPKTIAEIISIFRRVTKRTPRVLVSTNRLSTLYARRVQFRSIVLRELSRSRQPESLDVGIAKIMSSERSAFAQSLGWNTRKAA